MEVNFTNSPEVVEKKVFAAPSLIDFKSLPMLYRADEKFARSQKSGVVDVFLDKIKNHLSREYKYVSIDSRTHMLMEGMYPCIPGWHCDDFYRPSGDQPDLMNVLHAAPQEHFLMILGDCSNTQFVEGELTLVLDEGSNIYTQVHNKTKFILERDLNIVRGTEIKENSIVKFGPLDIHRGVPATHNGWRFFIRATFSDHREPKNEIRNQTQVYIESEDLGW